MREQLAPLAADFVVSQVDIPVGTTPVQILNQDPTRWGLMFGNVNVSPNVYVGINANLTGQNGFLINQSVNPLMVNFRDYGALVQVPWYAVSPSGVGQITMIIVQYRPSGE